MRNVGGICFGRSSGLCRTSGKAALKTHFKRTELGGKAGGGGTRRREDRTWSPGPARSPPLPGNVREAASQESENPATHDLQAKHSISLQSGRRSCEQSSLKTLFPRLFQDWSGLELTFSR